MIYDSLSPSGFRELNENLDPVVRNPVLDLIQLHVGLGFALRFRPDELALGVEVEMVKRTR